MHLRYGLNKPRPGAISLAGAQHRGPSTDGAEYEKGSAVSRSVYWCVVSSK